MGAACRVKIANDRGLSLPEILMVVAILGILLTIGFPTYRGMMDRYNVEKQIKEMHVDLLSARIRAMQRNRIHFVTFTSTQYAVYEDTSPAPDGDGKFTSATDSLIFNKSLMTKYPIALLPVSTQWSAATTSSPLQFNAKGLVDTSVTTTGTVHVTVSTGSEYDCITILELRNTLGKWDATSSSCKAK